MRTWLMALAALAGVYGAAGVGLAAAGAHLSGAPGVTTAANFLLFHAAALLGFCALAQARPTRPLLAAASLIAAGTLLFSGDLAVRGLAGIVLVHKAAPTGGLLLIAGWLGTAWAVPAALRRSADPE